MKWGLDELKQEYFDKIEDFSNKLAELWEVSRAGLFCQQFLPDDLRRCKKPRLIAPDQSFFTVEVEDIGKVYTRMSKVFLPD